MRSIRTPHPALGDSGIAVEERLGSGHGHAHGTHPAHTRHTDHGSQHPHAAYTVSYTPQPAALAVRWLLRPAQRGGVVGAHALRMLAVSDRHGAGHSCLKIA
jgi:hypothetical protein